MMPDALGDTPAHFEDQADGPIAPGSERATRVPVLVGCTDSHRADSGKPADPFCCSPGVREAGRKKARERDSPGQEAAERLATVVNADEAAQARASA
jgi:hypothetical protein